jgi:phthalate 4,5-cis-dihydrodiol dehydrogenase
VDVGARLMRLGVVGLGRAAASMLPSLAAHPHVRVVAAADPDPPARERFAADFGGATFPSIEPLCASGTVDAVYIATPHQQHAADVRCAAAYGKHAIVEKPMALTRADCEAMIGAARTAGTVLIVGHTHGFDPPVRIMRGVIESGELGALRTVVNLAYTDFLYRPRRPEELDTDRGGGIVYNQVPHQIEIARALDHAPVRSVRAVLGRWDPARPTEGAMSALLEFDDGVAATLVYSGYDRFDADELAGWVAESGEEKRPAHGAARASLPAHAAPDAEARLKAATGFAGRGVRSARGAVHAPHFGFLLASCERGDLRPLGDAVVVYGEDGVREIPVPRGRAYPDKDAVIDELYEAVAHGTPPLHDGAWGMATVDVALAILRSSRERREITLGEERAYAVT